MMNSGQQFHHHNQQQESLMEVERSFFKDFICCGNRLQSLHHLLEHYETDHVMKKPATQRSDDDSNADSSPENPWFSSLSSLNNNTYQQQQSQQFPNNSNSWPKSGISPYSSWSLEDYKFMTNVQETPVLTVSPSFLSGDNSNGGGDSRNTTSYESDNSDDFDFEHDPQQAYRRYIRSVRRKERRSKMPVTIQSADNVSENSSADGTNPAVNSNIALIAGSLPKMPRTRKYQCLVPGCNLVYRNQAGLRYHLSHFHTQADRELADRISEVVQDDRTNKPYACRYAGCDKRYRNSNGLKYHLLHHHNMPPPPPLQRKKQEWCEMLQQ